MATHGVKATKGIYCVFFFIEPDMIRLASSYVRIFMFTFYNFLSMVNLLFVVKRGGEMNERRLIHVYVTKMWSVTQISLTHK